MAESLTLVVPGNLGTNAGAGSDGVLIGQLTATNPTKAFLEGKAAACKAYADDGGTYTDFETEANESTGDDVELLPSTPAQHDAFYIGHSTGTFDRVDIQITTQGDGTWTITWEYWNGTAWTALSGVTDGTTGFTAAAAWVSVTFTEPTDWAKCTVDAVNAYWVRARVSAYTSVTTQPLAGQIYVGLSTAAFTDDTTDFTDAGAGDVALLPTYPMLNDAFYIGYSEKFCKVKVTTSQARTGTATITPQYYNGSAWASIATVDDDTAGWSTAAGTLLINFVPPSDWAQTSVNGTTAYWIRMKMTAITNVTQQPLATQGWVLPCKTGASGVDSPFSWTTFVVSMNGLTASGSTADSEFLILNCTTGLFSQVTWTKADAMVRDTGTLTVSAGDDLAIVQVTEDGTTEFADANFVFTLS